ncbi:hypothetical protein N8702_01535 [Verrucomicrobia bacterium]|nr:hypothetical protein [Verrucomicrobiota bacterium]|tara:strand:- start:415 stop:567 length:153 start_codon:yes stop_codon:yes gene_type:complete
MDRLDDFKVFVASSAGIGNWLVEIDLVLKIGISLVSLVYVFQKTVNLFKS